MLPHQFAEKILQLEIDLEENLNIRTIKALNELYGIGIDYYIDNEPKKARLLQKKMTNLLMRPSILEVLELDSLQGKQFDQRQEMGLKLNHKLRTQIVKFHEEANKNIQNIIENSHREELRLQNLRRDDINRQEELLQDRILKRVRSIDKAKQFRSCKNLRVNL